MVICACSKCRKLTCVDHGHNVPGCKVSSQTWQEHELQDERLALMANHDHGHPYQWPNQHPHIHQTQPVLVPPRPLDLSEGRIQLNLLYCDPVDNSFQSSPLLSTSAALLLLGCLFMHCWRLLGDAPHCPMSPPIFLHHFFIFLLIVASPRQSALAAPIPESDDHVM